MYVCNVCGHLQKNLSTVRINGDNLLGGYMDETSTSCPCCTYGELVEATECPVCGKFFDNTELNGVCECCIEHFETVETAFEYSEGRTTSVEINEFLAFVLDEEQINKILTKWVEENFTDHSKAVKEYLEDIPDQFSEWLSENKGR